MSPQKNIVITGVSSGIGKFLANYFLKQNCRVIGCSRTNVLLGTKRNFSHYCLDITQEEAVIKTVRSIWQTHKHIDVLINCAGIASMNHTLLMPAASAHAILKVNVLGTFLMSRECAKIMKIKRFGRIINFSSVAVPMKIEGEAMYAASKAAVETFSSVFAKEIAPFGITCNVIAPSPVETNLIRNVPQAKINRILESLAIHRLGSFDDIANAVDFFARVESSNITGQVLYLGGVS